MPRDITMKQLRIVTTVCAFSLSMAQVNAEDQFLVDNGKANAEIIISESPARSTRLAAAELQTYVAKISGARLPIRAEAGKTKGDAAHFDSHFRSLFSFELLPPSAHISLSIVQVEAEDQFLVDEGKAYAEIIISESPARLAAAELQTYVAKISGGRLPIRAEAEDGTLFIICDHQRYTLNRAGKRGVGSVQIAVFGEEDICAGKPVTDEVRLQRVVTQLQNTDDTSGAPGK